MRDSDYIPASEREAIAHRPEISMAMRTVLTSHAALDDVARDMRQAIDASKGRNPILASTWHELNTAAARFDAMTGDAT